MISSTRTTTSSRRSPTTASPTPSTDAALPGDGWPASHDRRHRAALVAPRRPPRRRALLPSVAGCIALCLFASLLINDLANGRAIRDSLVARDRSRSSWCPRRSSRAPALAARARRPDGPVPRAADDARRRTSRTRSRGARRPRPRRRSARPRGTGYVDACRPAGGDAATAGERAHRAGPARRPRIAALVYDASLDDDPRARRGGRRGGRDRARERAAAGRVARRGWPSCGLARADRRGRRRRAPAARAQPPRRRPAAARRAGDAAAAAAEPASATTPRRPSSSSTPASDGAGASRSRSCASSRAASIPPCSTTASSPRSSRWPPGRRFRPACATR